MEFYSADEIKQNCRDWLRVWSAALIGPMVPPQLLEPGGRGPATYGASHGPGGPAGGCSNKQILLRVGFNNINNNNKTEVTRVKLELTKCD